MPGLWISTPREELPPSARPEKEYGNRHGKYTFDRELSCESGATARHHLRALNQC